MEFTGAEFETRSLTIVALTPSGSTQAFMSEWARDTDDSAGEWSNSEMTTTGAGKVHGIWGNNPNLVERTYTGIPKHTKLQVSAKFWAIDSWDNEWGYMLIDGVEQWKGKAGAHSCTPDFSVRAVLNKS